MRIGIPKEIKNNENRVAIVPSGVSDLVESGHEVFVQVGAGIGSGFSDAAYEENGAKLVNTAEEAWTQEMVMKVKEPLPEEYAFFTENLILFTYLHLANEPDLTEALVAKKVTSIAYESIELSDGSLPLLTPMSEVAGRMATQIGAQLLEKTKGGQGILLSGIPGVSRGKVTIIGGGVVGTNAAKIAIGLGADVTILDVSPERLRELDDLFGHAIHTVMSNPLTIASAVATSDLVIGAVLLPGYRAPILITDDMVKSMKEGAVIVDVAIDQGGIVETIDRVTNHDHPTYIKYGVVHYAVANMPGAVPRTATLGLTNVTLSYARIIADRGVEKLVLENGPVARGINTMGGYVTNQAIAEVHGLKYYPAASLMLELT
ncbi:alanine dehydrogenase [Aquibacillus koreensis]|uniref:Alanine dehydrogenase n=1 Tax=Aquibacillus koreensis TaxID=279446 RepID=A0A9X4AJZ6_9BACI|nr:alanine dehydrogenase [Aquibacillus koreensis]MCT2535366.1 alanine dehydrogenase [Aquibacillus koreensis]MDC3422531.1 alanine dehydrogenase [Aquibacillus koreensis]